MTILPISSVSFDAEPVVRAMAEYIIFNLDENGYLKFDLADIVRDFGGEGDFGRRLRRRSSWSRNSTRPASAHATLASACSCSSLPMVPCRDPPEGPDRESPRRPQAEPPTLD